jgi:GAF domain-containing protein
LKRSHRGWGVISGGPEAQVRRARWTDLDRLSFLAQFSCLLSYSLDYAITLQTITSQMIPEIADWCFLQVQEGEGALQRLAAANLDSRRTAEKMKDLLKPQRYSTSASLPRNAEVASPIPDEWLDLLAVDTAERAALANTGAHSGMRVPLLLGNACLGLLTLFAANRTYTGVDLVFALEIGHRAAVAIHNARQYRSAVEAAVKRPLVSTE